MSEVSGRAGAWGPSATDWLAGGGETGKLIRSLNWSHTPLGDIDSWPQSLRTTVSLCLSSSFPMSLVWGPKRVLIYNDGYMVICGAKHPQAMGQAFEVCWSEVWDAIGPMWEGAFYRGESNYEEHRRHFILRRGYTEEIFVTYSYSPIRDETGGIGGVFHPVTEVTDRVLTERRLQALRDLAARTGQGKSAEEACAVAAETLSQHGADLPFVLLYLLNAEGKRAQLAGRAGLEAGTAASPTVVHLNGTQGPGAWPVARVAKSGRPELIPDLEGKFGPLRCGPWPEPPAAALVLPIQQPGATSRAGVLIAGVSPRRALDDGYRGFYDLVASQIATAIADARAYEEERRRAEALAELDRAKTTFFSNVSHEFRTPLTLMLGPVEDILAKPESGVLPENRELLSVVHRNCLRLLKLVNTLLDFSRIEADRMQASYEPTDLAALTSELASVFRSAFEKAGLTFTVDCPPLPERVYVDRDMWEKVVLNLLSNAFKFTFAGEVNVRQRVVDGHVELAVADTGGGIPEEEVANVFKRFHRIEGTPARTHEGTGIGLALVQELVKLHGGSVRVESAYGQGTTFTVTLRLGSGHLPADRLRAGRHLAPTMVQADAFLEEAMLWLPDPDDVNNERSPAAANAPSAVPRARVLLADDNADMRAYVRKLLVCHYEVEAVADGVAALEAARLRRPGLVLTDVMMPNLDGFGLLRALRSDPVLRTTPVILLSARAGEEARLEGLEAGADDYLIKPFSARELLARVRTNLELAKSREAAERAAGREEALHDANRRKDEFLAMLAHELRNPLAPLRNAIHILQMQSQSAETLEEVRAIMDRQVRQLTCLVDDLLDVSRIARGRVTLKTQRLDLARLVRSVAQDHWEDFETAGLMLKVDVPELPLWVQGDPTRLTQTLANLLDNAVKFTPRGGTVTIRLAVDDDSNNAVLVVRDTGIGIEPDMLPRLFEAFAQADRSLDRKPGGLGLGLALVKGLVELHGGRIDVKSDGVGQGAEFTVLLPKQEEAPVLADKPSTRPRSVDKRVRVLVVEDNRDAADSLRMLLELFGYDVAVAYSGPDGLATAKRDQPDVVVCDIGLPGMDGYAIATALRKNGRMARARLIAVTGYGQEEDRRRALEAGFDDHLVKPVDPENLLGRLEPVGRA